MKKVKIYVLALLAVMLTACGGNEFKVSGKIDGAGVDTKMVMEVSDNGLWLIVDSVKLSKNGEFSVNQAAPRHADVYRLRCGEKSIYFPIDSIDNVRIDSKLDAFATDYTLSGSDIAVDMMNIDKKAMQMHNANQESINEWKKELANKILVDPSGIVAYYIINKYVDDKPLFNPENKEDMRIIGAVANAYNTYKPNDPRTEYMVSMVVNNQRKNAVAVVTDTIVVDETPILDIQLQDENGKLQSLKDVAAQGKVVVLNFTVYSDELSPAFNKELADQYKKYEAKGLEIYQIAYDTDEFQWRQAAKNLPWITVYDGKGIYSENLARYNVSGFPTTFVINRKGEIVERVVDVTTLSSAIARYL